MSQILKGHTISQHRLDVTKLKIGELTELSLPRGAVVLTVQERLGFIELWEHHPALPKGTQDVLENVGVVAHVSGPVITEEESMRYISTVVYSDLILHFFQIHKPNLMGATHNA